MKPIIHILSMAPFVCCIAFSGWLTGSIMASTERYTSSVEGLQIKQVQPTTVPTVHIAGIENQQLTGAVHGNVRFMLGQTPIIASGAFSIPAGPLLRHKVSIHIPEGAVFVASLRGKKYYSVHSSRAQSLAPSNRVYFASAQEAQAAGYIR